MKYLIIIHFLILICESQVFNFEDVPDVFPDDPQLMPYKTRTVNYHNDQDVNYVQQDILNLFYQQFIDSLIQQPLQVKQQTKKNPLKQALTVLIEQVDKLNWPTFSQALSEMLQNIQSARIVEKENFSQKYAVYQKLISINQRKFNKMKIELAKDNENINQNLQPYKNELSESLNYRTDIFKKIEEAMSNNEYEQNIQSKNINDEITEMTEACRIIDEMINTLEGAKSDVELIQVQKSIQPLSSKVSEIFMKNPHEPISVLVSSMVELMNGDFSQRQALKSAIDLLQKLRQFTIDQKLQLIDQRYKLQQQYQKRKATVQEDKATNENIYASKLEQYNSVQQQLDSLKKYIEGVSENQDQTNSELTYLKGVWAKEQGIQTKLDQKLLTRASDLNDALKALGKGVEFQGEMLTN